MAGGYRPRTAGGCAASAAKAELAAGNDRLAEGAHERSKPVAGVLADRLPRRQRQLVGAVLDAVAVLAAGVRQLTLAVEPAPGADALGGGPPLVVGPRARRLQDARWHLAGRAVHHEGLAPVEALDQQESDVAVAAELAQQRDRVPQHQVRLAGPGEWRVPREQRPALWRAGLGRGAGEPCGLGNLGRVDGVTEDAAAEVAGARHPGGADLLGRRDLPCSRYRGAHHGRGE